MSPFRSLKLIARVVPGLIAAISLFALAFAALSGLLGWQAALWFAKRQDKTPKEEEGDEIALKENAAPHAISLPEFDEVQLTPTGKLTIETSIPTSTALSSPVKRTSPKKGVEGWEPRRSPRFQEGKETP